MSGIIQCNSCKWFKQESQLFIMSNLMIYCQIAQKQKVTYCPLYLVILMLFFLGLSPSLCSISLSITSVTRMSFPSSFIMLATHVAQFRKPLANNECSLWFGSILNVDILRLGMLMTRLLRRYVETYSGRWALFYRKSSV